MTAHEALDAYAAFFESLTPASLHRLEELCAPEVRFRDPFNDVRGLAPFRTVLAKMFHEVAEPRFEVSDRAVSSRACYLRWTFTFRGVGSNKDIRRIDGISEIHLNAASKVIAHIDYWDAGAEIYEKVPVIGSVLRVIKRRLSAAT